MAEITLFESSDRAGGKVLSRHFAQTGARYEAGAAELYDYSHLGPDPLKQLILDMGLAIAPMDGPAVVFEGRVLTTEEDLRQHFGAEGYAQLQSFDKAAHRYCTPAEYYDSDWVVDARDRKSRRTFSAHLDAVTDIRVRRYIETVVHSDLAVEPERTSALYGLQNWLMNDAAYLRLYTIVGGLEQLVTRVAAQLQIQWRLRTRVLRVGFDRGSGYRLVSNHAGQLQAQHFDGVIVALPANQLSQIVWDDPALATAMRVHRAHYDHPAHYLRITLVFATPFWREHLQGDFFMLDAFGGCCVYDESGRDPYATYGVLGWLLAGDAALIHANLADAQLAQLALASLPDGIRPQPDAVLECAVHRWAGAVNGWPMGKAIQPPSQRHAPAGGDHPGVLVVGDYLFDSTLNGVLDSAECAVDVLENWLNASAPAAATAGALP